MICDVRDYKTWLIILSQHNVAFLVGIYHGLMPALREAGSPSPSLDIMLLIVTADPDVHTLQETQVDITK